MLELVRSSIRWSCHLGLQVSQLGGTLVGFCPQLNDIVTGQAGAGLGAAAEDAAVVWLPPSLPVLMRCFTPL